MKGLLLRIGGMLSVPKIFVPILFILLSVECVQAKTVVIGSGSGYISVPNMTGLNPGDILAIVPGKYSGGSFNNLRGITITNHDGVVIFTKQVTLNTLVECEFSGFQFQDIDGIAIRWDGNSRRVIEKNISFNNCSGSTNDASDHVVYNGDTSSLKLYLCTFDSLTLYRSGMVMLGGWGEAKDGACYMDSIIFSRIKIDSSITNGSEVRGIIFRINAYDWKVTFKGQNNLSGDIGMFFMNGNGSIHNIYRFGGRGYILRIWNVGLKTPGNMFFYNNIDLNSTQYGSIDTRVDSREFTKYTTGGNCFVFNNTAGNKEEHIGYWSSIAVIGSYAPPYVLQVKNNLGFNLSTNGKPKIAMDQSSQTWITDTSNNLYFDKPDGVIDPVTGVPVANSAVIGKGATLPLVTEDIYHNARQGAYDIGAVQHGGAIIKPPADLPPIAITEIAKVIFLPATNSTLDGSKSYDPDGNITKWSWEIVQGSGAVLATPTVSTTKVSGLTQGIYVFKLTVTDNNDSTSFSLDTITVKAAGNLPPIANAGADQTIRLPKDSVEVNGSASKDQDNGGLIATYSWTQSAGPSGAIIINPSAAITSIDSLISGTYVFRLTVADSSGAKGMDSVTITVKDIDTIPVKNISPVANAGASVTIILPVDSATLDGSKSSDADGSILSYRWTKTSGPNTPVATGDTSPLINLSGLVAGQYTYQLQVMDDSGAVASANVKITVAAPPDIAPVANAGPDHTITFPTDSVTLDGSASYDPDGNVKTYSWSKASGQGTVTITNGNTANPAITGLAPGVYVFQLTVTDNAGATDMDEVVITVNPEPTIPNQSPIANAGNNVTISAPATSVLLDGSSSFDPDGSIAYYVWNQVSGPSAATITNSGTVKPTAAGLVPGSYVFQLTVTDDKSSSDFDQVTVNVLPAIPKLNQPPVASAGQDTTIFLPNRSYVLSASGSYDPDGSIAQYEWKEISGPNSAMTSVTDGDQVNVSNLQEGLYEFQVTVTDNQGARTTATIKIAVEKGAKDDFSVYPNPAHDFITAKISNPVNGTVRMSVYDMNGRTVLMDESGKSSPVYEKTLTINGLSSGMYTILVNIGNQKTMVTKFIKQ